MFRDKRRVRQLLALLILTSFTLITIDYRSGDESPLASVRRFAGAVFGPIERAVSAVVRPIGNALSTVGDLGTLDGEVKRLREEQTQVRGEARRVEDLRRQLDEARGLLKIANDGQFRLVSARVIGVAPSSFEWTVTIDAGSRDGVRKDMTVVNGDGLVGRVISAAPFSSQVLLAIDAKSKVGARIAHTGEGGLLGGNGLDDMTFEVTNPAVQVATGQPIVTAGSTFVAGVPIGQVKETRSTPGALTRTVVVTPYVRFTSLDLVGVIIKQERRTPRDALVPARPAPTQTATPAR
jgi:rod shape-determining protein MreC